MARFAVVISGEEGPCDVYLVQNCTHDEALVLARETFVHIQEENLKGLTDLDRYDSVAGFVDDNFDFEIVPITKVN